MIWNQPAALAGLALLALPVLVHLLIRHHATRVVFPAMRFVPPVRAAAVRLRAPSDRGLLLLRAAVIAAAVLATALPLLTTAARKQAWASRVARAIVVDTSPSVPAGVAAKLADQAAAGAFVSHRFASRDLRDAVRRAVAWLDTAAGAGRELTIVSDFQRGSIDAADLAGVPAATGVNVLRAGKPDAAGAGGSIDGWRDARWTAALTLDPASTAVTWTRVGPATPSGVIVRTAAADQALAERAAEAARSFGVAVGNAGEEPRPVEVIFAGADAAAGTSPSTPWIAAAAIALRSSALLAETGTGAQVGERSGVMTVKTGLTGRSPFAPAVIRAVLVAASPSVIDPEAETASIDDATLSRMVRPRTPVTSARPPSGESDGRWLWGLALALLVVEAVVRRRAEPARRREVRAHAA